MIDADELRFLIILNSKQRLPHYEKEIFTNESLTATYVKQLLGLKKLRFSLPTALHMYARDIMKSRWIEAETIILKSPETTFYYVTDVYNYGLPVYQRQRWIECEPTILRNPWFSYLYAKDIIKGRWEEAEAVLIAFPEYTYYYLNAVLRERGVWPEGDRLVSQNGYHDVW